MSASTVTAADLTVRFAQTYVACIFATSLAAKAHRKETVDEFAVSVSRLVPRAPTRLTVAAVFVGEFSVVLALALGAVLPGLSLAAGLLVAFTVTIALAIRAKRRVSCRCFGQSSTPVSPVHLIRNGVLLAVTLAGLGSASAGAGGVPLLHPAVLATCGVAVVAAACTVIADRFSDLFVLTPKEQ